MISPYLVDVVYILIADTVHTWYKCHLKAIKLCSIDGYCFTRDEMC